MSPPKSRITRPYCFEGRDGAGRKVPRGSNGRVKASTRLVGPRIEQRQKGPPRGSTFAAGLGPYSDGCGLRGCGLSLGVGGCRNRNRRTALRKTKRATRRQYYRARENRPWARGWRSERARRVLSAPCLADCRDIGREANERKKGKTLRRYQPELPPNRGRDGCIGCPRTMLDSSRSRQRRRGMTSAHPPPECTCAAAWTGSYT